MKNQLMIYGAYGYTGELMVREAVRLGIKPIIAGRTAGKLKPVADALGLEARVFDVTNADFNLEDVAVVVNCAGPFASTAPSMIEACLRQRVHYIDITGEIPVFQYCHEQDMRARAAGIMICPGAGFDIVPTDCLAASLKERLPDADRIDIAFNFGTRPSIGTIKTSIEGAAKSGMIRRDSRLVPVPQAHKIRRIPFPGGKRWGAAIPWGDVYTAGISTGVPNGIVFGAVPLALAIGMRLGSLVRPLLAMPAVNRSLQRLAERFLDGGPKAEALHSERTEFWAEATNPKGQRVTGFMSGPNVYALTVDTAMAIAQHCLTQPVKTGYQTPSMLMGSQFFARRPGVIVYYA